MIKELCQSMKRPTIFIFLVSVLLSSLIVYSLRHTRNDWYEFCTTHAFGWPFAWRIENCECDGQGGLVEVPPSALALNSGVVVAFGIATAGMFHFFTRLRGR